MLVVEKMSGPDWASLSYDQVIRLNASELRRGIKTMATYITKTKKQLKDAGFDWVPGYLQVDKSKAPSSRGIQHGRGEAAKLRSQFLKAVKFINYKTFSLEGAQEYKDVQANNFATALENYKNNVITYSELSPELKKSILADPEFRVKTPLTKKQIEDAYKWLDRWNDDHPARRFGSFSMLHAIEKLIKDGRGQFRSYKRVKAELETVFSDDFFEKIEKAKQEEIRKEMEKNDQHRGKKAVKQNYTEEEGVAGGTYFKPLKGSGF